MAFLVLWFVLPQAGPATELETLKLLISAEQQAITAPFPARVTLHLHNAGREALWLYRRVRSRAADGSTLADRLGPVAGERLQAVVTPGAGTVLESVGLPHPRLVRLGPGDDYEEKTTLHLAPALTEVNGKKEPIWGRYRLSVTYGARISSAESVARNLGVQVWQGEVTSNTIELELLPPGAEARGSVSGRVIGSEGHLLRDVIVSLSDQQERLIDQGRSDSEGQFSFAHLPFRLYWVTARLPNAPKDTVIFRHVELTPTVPATTLELVMLPQETYDPRKLFHKPVLFRVTDALGRPLDKVRLEVTWSDGAVVDNVKGEAFDDGTAALELIPGRNFVTLKRRGCRNQDLRVDVAEEGIVDAFKLVMECAK